MDNVVVFDPSNNRYGLKVEERLKVEPANLKDIIRGLEYFFLSPCLNPPSFVNVYLISLSEFSLDRWCLVFTLEVLTPTIIKRNLPCYENHCPICSCISTEHLSFRTSSFSDRNVMAATLLSHLLASFVRENSK